MTQTQIESEFQRDLQLTRTFERMNLSQKLIDKEVGEFPLAQKSPVNLGHGGRASSVYK